jgi:hypothetical protein
MSTEIGQLSLGLQCSTSLAFEFKLKAASMAFKHPILLMLSLLMQLRVILPSQFDSINVSTSSPRRDLLIATNPHTNFSNQSIELKPSVQCCTLRTDFSV